MTRSVIASTILLALEDAVDEFRDQMTAELEAVNSPDLKDAMYESLRLCQSCQGLVIDCINRCPACRALLKVL